MSKTMKIIVKYPGKPAELAEIPKVEDCSEYKKIIGCGCIGGVTMPCPISDVYMLVDDNGKLECLEPNFFLHEYEDLIVGTAVFVGIGKVLTKMPDGCEFYESDFVSLNPVCYDYLFDYLDKNDVNG